MGIHGIFCIPIGDDDCRCSAITGNRSDAEGAWLELECPKPRTDTETRSTWERIKESTQQRKYGSKKRTAELIKSTGVSQKPALGRLSLDFVEGVQYDPMHQALLGWVRHLAALCSRQHPKHERDTPAHTALLTDMRVINSSLHDGSRGIPTDWARPPLSMDHLSHYKAEDFKHLGLYFGKVMFRGAHFDNRITLWANTSKMIQIILDATPFHKDANELRSLVEQSHALFSEIFFSEPAQVYCFTPQRVIYSVDSNAAIYIDTYR